MARVPQLRAAVLESVALHAASALASVPYHPSDEADASLHESLPLWLMTGAELERLRTNHRAGLTNVKFRDYLQETPRWLHLLYRGGKPYGYVHSSRGPRGRHTVTNVSVTKEARLIQEAIDHVDQERTHENAQGGVFECPKVSLAGIMVFQKRRAGEPLVCLFRDPLAPSHGPSPSLIDARALIERLLELHVSERPTE